MPVVKEIRAEDLQDQYVLVFSNGQVQFKDAVKNTIRSTINPSEEYLAQLSKGGKAKAENEKNEAVDELLTALKIPVDEPRGRYLAGSALHGSRGEGLRSFLVLLEQFKVEEPERPIIQVMLSDAAYADYIARMTTQDAAGTIEAWMEEQEDLDTPDFENTKVRDNLSGPVIEVLRVHPEKEDNQ